VPGDDFVKAERALSFAERRMEEMQALAEKRRLQDLGLGVEGYDDALNMTLARIERAGDKGLATGNITALVAKGTTRHLSVLDTVYDIVPSEAKEAIAHARNVSEKGYFHAMAALAKNNTVRAAEMNLAVMEGRLNRISIGARVGDAEGVEIALHQFEAMAKSGEKISQRAQETGINITSVEGLMTRATYGHLQVRRRSTIRCPNKPNKL